MVKENKKKVSVFKNISSSSTFNKNLSTSLENYGSGMFGGSKQNIQRSVGRPRNIFIHRSPFTGKPIPATQYYKEIKLVQNQQKRIAELRQQQIQQQYAQKGVPPAQIQQVILSRMREQFIQNQNQQQPQQIQQQVQNNNQLENLPNGTIIPRGTQTWKYARGVVGEEGSLFGKVKKIYGTEESFFN